ncbi:MAG: hypothetical protein P8L64_03580 [Flavobacteriales bacterium]|nr:hypothetical protein [Flavobacteriales bacterium]
MKKSLLLLFALMALTFVTQAQTSNKKSDSSKSKTEKVHKAVQHIMTFSAMSDIHNEDDFDLLLDSPQLGFELSYRKQDQTKLLSNGFSFGWQPIATADLEIETQGQEGTLKAVNQMIHAHYTVTLSPFKQKRFQPYLEGIVGAKGVALSSSYDYDDPQVKDVNDIPYLSATLNYGYAGGFRLRATELIYLDVRYARVQSGNLKRISEIDIEENGDLSYTTDEWKAPVGYLRAGISLSF